MSKAIQILTVATVLAALAPAFGLAQEAAPSQAAPPEDKTPTEQPPQATQGAVIAQPPQPARSGAPSGPAEAPVAQLLSRPAKRDKEPYYTLKYKNGLVNLVARDADLREVLLDLAKRSKVSISISKNYEAKVRGAYKDVPLAKFITQVTTNSILVFTPDDKGRSRLDKAIIIGTGNKGVAEPPAPAAASTGIDTEPGAPAPAGQKAEEAAAGDPQGRVLRETPGATSPGVQSEQAGDGGSEATSAGHEAFIRFLEENSIQFDDLDDDTRRELEKAEEALRRAAEEFQRAQEQQQQQVEQP